MERTLTPRQAEIKERLDKRMGAREIADDLGITRNAVYQQIQALRRKGALSSSFTPTGQIPRNVAGADGDVLLTLVELLRSTADELERVSAQIRSQVGS